MNFEQALKDLEILTAQLEKGDLPLEKNLEIYEQGIKTIKEAESYLQKMQGKIEQLNAEEDKGKINTN